MTSLAEPRRVMRFGLVAAPLLTVSACSAWVEVNYHGGTVAQDSRLYFIEEVVHLERHGLPIPERPPEQRVSATEQIVEFDLFTGRTKYIGEKTEQAESLKWQPCSQLLLNDRGEPWIQPCEDFYTKLKSALPPSCKGDLYPNSQDWRVVYYRCAEPDVLYRFDMPFDRATPILLGDAGGMPGERGYDFFSVAGTPQIYARSYNDVVYEIDTSVTRDGTRATRLDIDGQTARKLIGISSTLRIYETGSDPSTLEVRVERAGQKPQAYKYHDAPKGVSLSRHYLAASGLVVWNFLSSGDAEPYVTLNLATGEFRKTSLVRRR